MTNTTSPLNNVRRYDGHQKIHTANGNSFPMRAIGDISKFLTYIFESPSLSINLISVGQLVDQDFNVKFSHDGCVIQDQVSESNREGA